MTEPTPIHPEQPWQPPAQQPEQAAQPAPPYPYPWQQQPPLPPTNGMAIASMVLGIAGITIGWLLALIGAFVMAVLAVVFGHVALVDIKRTGKRGRGMAIAGLVLGYVILGIGVVAMLAAAISEL